VWLLQHVRSDVSGISLAWRSGTRFLEGSLFQNRYMFFLLYNTRN
jgi:hypothetical protein